MKRIFFIFFFNWLLVGFAQTNLIRNSSFDFVDTCELAISYVYKTHVPPWFLPSRSTTDVFNSCSTANFLSTPSNISGFQFPKSGRGYIGICTYWSTLDAIDYREYISIRLSESLKSKHKYCINYYASSSDLVKYASNNLGAYISSDSLNFSWPFLQNIPVLPQINHTNIITDTANWTLISGEFIAQGGEQFLTIGNFFNDANTSISIVNPNASIDFVGAYYYIDDVSLIECNQEVNAPNVFTPNGDGINDVWQVQTLNIDAFECTIYNRWGIKVTTLTHTNAAWDGRLTNGIEASDGVYYYVLKATGIGGEQEFESKGFLQLVR
jgi:gliding motility-associated-like protein